MITTRRIVLGTAALLAMGAGPPAFAADAPLAPTPEFFAKHTAPEGSSFFISNAPKGERGDRMVIRGIVTDGKAPIPNASIYVYNADSEGRYDPLEPRPGMGTDNPRLSGLMRTDSVGRYVYGSLKPAPSPGTTTPAPVHFVVTAAGFKGRAFEMLFEGDPLVTAEHTKNFVIRPAVKDSNKAWQVVYDIVMERE